MTPKKFTFLALLLSVNALGAASVQADEVFQKPAAIACASLKAAKTYAETRAANPAFAQDLLDRAACFQISAETSYRPLAKPEQGFQSIQLLRGHKVWVPAE